MQDETNIPLVDILTEQLGEEVVMNGEEYVYKNSSIPIKRKIVDVALSKQLELLDFEKVNNTKKALMLLCDTKQNNVQNMLLGYKATNAQIERYKDKYVRAKENEFDDDTNKKIIYNHEKYLSSIRSFVDLMEYFRSAVDDLIVENKIIEANKLIEIAKDFNENTTLAQIKELLGGIKV